MKTMMTNTLGLALVIGFGVFGLTSQVNAQTVTVITNPYSEFGVVELQNAKFVRGHTPAEGTNPLQPRPLGLNPLQPRPLGLYQPAPEKAIS